MERKTYMKMVPFRDMFVYQRVADMTKKEEFQHEKRSSFASKASVGPLLVEI